LKANRAEQSRAQISNITLASSTFYSNAISAKEKKKKKINRKEQKKNHITAHGFMPIT